MKEGEREWERKEGRMEVTFYLIIAIRYKVIEFLRPILAWLDNKLWYLSVTLWLRILWWDRGEGNQAEGNKCLKIEFKWQMKIIYEGSLGTLLYCFIRKTKM